MATLETVLDVESEVESVFSGLIQGVGLAVKKSDSNTILETPRVDIVATVVEEGPHQYTIAGTAYTGRRVYDQKRVSLDVSLVYSPTVDQGIPAKRGTLRKLFTDYFAVSTAFKTNNYLLLASDSFRQTSGSRNIEVYNNDEQAVLRSSYELFIFLNPTALDSAT